MRHLTSDGSPGRAEGAAPTVTDAVDPARATVVTSIRDPSSRLRKLFSLALDFVRAHKVGFSLFIAVLVYTALYGSILGQRYWAFQTYAWDLGNYNQGMYTALYGHRLFYYTADLPSYNPGSLQAAHFSPYLFVLLPFYALAPNPPGLILIQTAALAASSIPLYLFSVRLGLSKQWSLFLAAAYLLSPVLMGIGWYDVHPEAFLPLAIIVAVYCYYFGRWWTFLIAWLAALSVIETGALLLLALAAAGLLALVYDLTRGRRGEREVWIKSILGTLLPLAWIGLAVLTNDVVLNSGISTLSTGYSGAYSILGPNLGFLDVIPYALVHPASAAAAVSYQWNAKLAYALVLFGSLAFLPLLGPKRLLLPVAVWLALVTLSNGFAWYEFGDQFAAYPLPFLAACAPFGLQKLKSAWSRIRPSVKSVPVARPVPRAWRSLRRSQTPYAVASAIAGAVIVSSGLISPLTLGPHWMDPYIHHGLPQVTSHDQILHNILSLVPPTAGILTVSEIFPEVSNRMNAYVVPLSTAFRPDVTFYDALDGYINDSQFVLIDFSLDFFASSVLIRFGNLSGFGILAEEDFAVLYERGWAGLPILWVPLSETWAGGQLFTTANSYVDKFNSTEYGSSLSSVPYSGPGSLLWYGPFRYGLPAGTYAVSFWLQVKASAAGPQLNSDVELSPLDIALSLQGSLTLQHDYAFDFSTGPKQILSTSNVTYLGRTPYTWTENVTVQVTWPWLAVWGVSGWTQNSGAQVRLYAVSLHQLRP